MLLLVITTVLFLVTCTGIGKLFLFSARWAVRDNPFISFFIGFALAGIWFMACAFFVRLGVMTLLPLFALAAAGLGLAAKGQSLRQMSRPHGKIILFSAILAIFGLIQAWVFSATRCTPYDTYLYHASWVSWANAFNVVPGLANLHGRLGTNSLYLMVAAGIDVGCINHRSAYVLPCLFIIASTGFLLWEILFSTSRMSRMACLCMLAWMLAYAPTGMNLYFDVPTMLFLFAAFLEVAILADQRSPSPTAFAVPVLFAATSFAIKQTSAFGLIAVVVWALYLLWRSGRMNLKNLAAGLATPMVLAVIHVARNLIVSGYPAYPFPHLRFEFPWTVRQSLIQNVYDSAKYFRRMPGIGISAAKSLALGDWAEPWFMRWRSGQEWMLFWAGLMSLILWIRPLWRKEKKAWFVFAILVSALVFWFYSSPNLRYGGAYFFLLLAFSAGFCEPGRREFIASTLLTGLMVLQVGLEGLLPLRSCLILITPVAMVGLLTAAKDQHWARLLAGVAVLCLFVIIHRVPLANRHLLDVVPIGAGKVIERTLENTQNPPLKIWTPVKGDQCGDAPLPCTPYPDDALKLIIPGDLSSGFRVE